MEYNSYPLFSQDHYLLDQNNPSATNENHLQASKLANQPSNGNYESFIDLSELAVNSHLKGHAQITTTIYESKTAVKHGRGRKPRAKRQASKINHKSSTRSRHGISSFQAFNVTTESVMSIRSIMQKQVGLPAAAPLISRTNSSYQNSRQLPHSRIIKVGRNEKENVPLNNNRRTKRGKFRPTILKCRKNPVKNRIVGSNSPIKNLTFSPSRFLNTSTLTNSDHHKKPSQSDTSKELSFDDDPFSIEDSGFVGNCDSDISSSFLPPSLTSTPISKKRNGSKASTSPDFLFPSSNSLSFYDNSSDCEDLTWLVDSNTSLADETTDSSYSNLISEPSTSILKQEDELPTKDSTFSDIHFSFNDQFSVFDPDDLESINLVPLGNDQNMKIDHQSKAASQSLRKSVRKSLILEEFSSINTPSSSPHISSPNLSQTISNLNYEQSTLIGDKTVVERRVLAPGKKSIYRTWPKRISEKGIVFDKNWVQIACGRSFDQKVMTEAAKRCLRKRYTSK